MLRLELLSSIAASYRKLVPGSHGTDDKAVEPIKLYIKDIYCKLLLATIVIATQPFNKRHQEKGNISGYRGVFCCTRTIIRLDSFIACRYKEKRLQIRLLTVRLRISRFIESSTELCRVLRDTQ